MPEKSLLTKLTGEPDRSNCAPFVGGNARTTKREGRAFAHPSLELVAHSQSRSGIENGDDLKRTGIDNDDLVVDQNELVTAPFG